MESGIKKKIVLSQLSEDELREWMESHSAEFSNTIQSLEHTRQVYMNGLEELRQQIDTKIMDLFTWYFGENNETLKRIRDFNEADKWSIKDWIKRKLQEKKKDYPNLDHEMLFEIDDIDSLIEDLRRGQVEIEQIKGEMIDIYTKEHMCMESLSSKYGEVINKKEKQKEELEQSKKETNEGTKGEIESLEQEINSLSAKKRIFDDYNSIQEAKYREKIEKLNEEPKIELTPQEKEFYEMWVKNRLPKGNPQEEYYHNNWSDYSIEISKIRNWVEGFSQEQEQGVLSNLESLVKVVIQGANVKMMTLENYHTLLDTIRLMDELKDIAPEFLDKFNGIRTDINSIVQSFKEENKKLLEQENLKNISSLLQDFYLNPYLFGKNGKTPENFRLLQECIKSLLQCDFSSATEKKNTLNNVLWYTRAPELRDLVVELYYKLDENEMLEKYYKNKLFPEGKPKRLSIKSINLMDGKYSFSYKDGETAEFSELSLLKRWKEKFRLFSRKTRKAYGYSISAAHKADPNITARIHERADDFEIYMQYLSGKEVQRLNIDYGANNRFAKRLATSDNSQGWYDVAKAERDAVREDQDAYKVVSAIPGETSGAARAFGPGFTQKIDHEAALNPITDGNPNGTIFEGRE